jgi:hypothetical protein
MTISATKEHEAMQAGKITPEQYADRIWKQVSDVTSRRIKREARSTKHAAVEQSGERVAAGSTAPTIRG